MKTNEHSLLKFFSGVSLAIFLCRILGLIREILLAKIFGGGILMTAWGLAFMIPNLFRRLLGEGALTQALIPILAEIMKNEGEYNARKKMFPVFVLLGGILGIICVVIGGLSLLLSQFIEVPRVKYALELTPLIIPYSFFICLSGVISGILNLKHRYFIPALSAVSLNVFMILCLLLVSPYKLQAVKPVLGLNYLAIAVLISGAFQLLLLLALLMKIGMMPVVSFSGKILSEPTVKELFKLTIPGIFGASLVQISFVIDRSMACYLGDYAVPALNYSDRIIDLPIGIFAVAMGSVFLPTLSHLVAENDSPGAAKYFLFALRNILFVSIPASLYIIFFRYPLIKAFYMRGAFDERALNETAWAMLFYAPGIPLFCAIKIIVTNFYSKKDMKTPVMISATGIAINVLLNAILMWPLKQGGIALATVISSAFNCIMLVWILRSRYKSLRISHIIPCVLEISVSSLISAFLAKFVFSVSGSFFTGIIDHSNLIAVFLSAIVFVNSFLLINFFFKSQEQKEWFAIVRKRTA